MKKIKVRKKKAAAAKPLKKRIRATKKKVVTLRDRLTAPREWVAMKPIPLDLDKEEQEKITRCKLIKRYPKHLQGEVPMEPTTEKRDIIIDAVKMKKWAANDQRRKTRATNKALAEGKADPNKPKRKRRTKKEIEEEREQEERYAKARRAKKRARTPKGYVAMIKKIARGDRP